jgi:nucleotide-binding universal stress UspA family protein
MLERDGGRTNVLEKILVPIDGGDRAPAAAEVAAALAKLAGSSVRVVHVWEGGPVGHAEADPDETPEEARSRATAASVLAEEGIETSAAVRADLSSHVGRQILDEASEWGATLVVMGAGKRLADRIGLGGPVEYVLHHGRLPVLVVP